MSGDRKLKQQAGMELSFANSQLEILRQELEGINSTLDVYQFERCIYIHTIMLFFKYIK